jgi:hypothetical protein
MPPTQQTMNVETISVLTDPEFRPEGCPGMRKSLNSGGVPRL